MHPMMQERRRSGIARLAWTLFWVLLVVYVVHHPSEAAANARALMAWLTSASESIASFLQHTGGH